MPKKLIYYLIFVFFSFNYAVPTNAQISILDRETKIIGDQQYFFHDRQELVGEKKSVELAGKNVAIACYYIIPSVSRIYRGRKQMKLEPYLIECRARTAWAKSISIYLKDSIPTHKALVKACGGKWKYKCEAIFFGTVEEFPLAYGYDELYDTVVKVRKKRHFLNVDHIQLTGKTKSAIADYLEIISIIPLPNLD